MIWVSTSVIRPITSFVTIVGAHVLGITLPETNIFAPEKRPPQKEISSSKHWFSGAFAVSFREGTYSSWWFQTIWKICLSNWIISPNRDENQNSLKPRKPENHKKKTFLWNESMASPIPTNWGNQWITGWWLNQPSWKILVKMGIFPNFRGENKTYVKPPT